MGPAALLFETFYVTNFWTHVYIVSSYVRRCGGPHHA